MSTKRLFQKQIPSPRKPRPRGISETVSKFLSQPRRAGAILALVLVSLLVVSLFGAALIQAVLVQHRQREVFQKQQQCFWLAEAGVQRAVRGMAQSPDYPGETWTVPAEVLGTPQPGEVVIAVTEAPDSPGTRQVRVEARLSDGPLRRVVCRRELTVPAAAEKPAGQADEKKASDNRAAEPAANPVPET